MGRRGIVSCLAAWRQMSGSCEHSLEIWGLQEKREISVLGGKRVGFQQVPSSVKRLIFFFSLATSVFVTVRF